MIPGLQTAHKPVGASSHSLVLALREQAAASGPRIPALCHGGTLDPFAEGLLLLLSGPATKLFTLFHELPKRYLAEVVWGMETDTGNPFGVPVLRGSGPLDPEPLERALAAQLGWQEQVPPATSAKKVRGEPAYRRVMRGEQVELPASRVFLHSARWLEHQLPSHSRLEITCRGGYYVRSLARDLGRAIGCGAHLRSLSRSHIGPWEDPGAGPGVHVSGAALLPFLRTRRLDDQEVGALRAGQTIPPGTLLSPVWKLPTGFPPPVPRVAALHQGRLRFVLEEREPGRLAVDLELGRGI